MSYNWYKISPRQNMEVGVLIALLLLMVNVYHPEWFSLWIVGIVLAITLIWPLVFKPVTFLWFGLAGILSRIFSQVFLSIIFILMVVPVGIVRKLMGIDQLQLRKFRKERSSTYQDREHVFEAMDFDNVF